MGCMRSVDLSLQIHDPTAAVLLGVFRFEFSFFDGTDDLIGFSLLSRSRWPWHLTDEVWDACVQSDFCTTLAMILNLFIFVVFHVTELVALSVFVFIFVFVFFFAEQVALAFDWEGSLEEGCARPAYMVGEMGFELLVPAVKRTLRVELTVDSQQVDIDSFEDETDTVNENSNRCALMPAIDWYVNYVEKTVQSVSALKIRES